jgi:hypothetical protein
MAIDFGTTGASPSRHMTITSGLVLKRPGGLKEEM